ncbi:putative integrase [Orientia tsutsugamushi str. UT144]|nr:integrase [Orientia tsutsugamushi]KJW07179.1 putative integrase [Orientia tsutsugamushi str. UT144]
MANRIDSREVKRKQQIEENENRIKERERKANDITFKELCYKYIEEYAKIYTIN